MNIKRLHVNITHDEESSVQILQKQKKMFRNMKWSFNTPPPPQSIKKAAFFFFFESSAGTTKLFHTYLTTV